MRRRLHCQSGFTLLELVLVCLLLALMSAILYGTLNGIMRSRSVMDSQRTMYRTTRYVFSRVNQELSSRVAESLVGEDAGENAPSGGRTRRRVYLKGLSETSGRQDKDSIRFVSDGAAQETFAARSNRGRVEISYRLEEDEDAEDTGQIRHFVLVREEIPAGIKDSEEQKARRLVFPIAERIASLNFRFFKQDQWYDTWPGTQRGFPELVEMRLGVIGENEELEYFQTNIALQRRPKRRSTSSYEEFLTQSQQ